ncbi:MAG: hypothetical protein AAFX99_27395 [Myxococcota bacterium]
MAEHDRAALVLGFGDDIANGYSEHLLDWDAQFEQEYNAGPDGQPSRTDVLATLFRMM